MGPFVSPHRESTAAPESCQRHLPIFLDPAKVPDMTPLDRLLNFLPAAKLARVVCMEPSQFAPSRLTPGCIAERVAAYTCALLDGEPVGPVAGSDAAFTRA